MYVMNKIINLAWNGIPDFHISGKQIYISKPRNSINFLSFHELWKFIVVWFETGIFWSSLRQFEKKRQSKHFFSSFLIQDTRIHLFDLYHLGPKIVRLFISPKATAVPRSLSRRFIFSPEISYGSFFSQGDNRPKSSLICDCLNVFLTLLGNPENRRWGSFGYIGLLTLLGCSVHTAIKLLSNWFNNYHHAPPHDSSSSINCSENQKCFNEQFQYYLE